jgi:adenine deaminase
MKNITGNIVDVVNKRIFPGEVVIKSGNINKIIERSIDNNDYIIPGFVDSHIHIESSMLTPENFSERAVKHGTIALVADPHEIANVLGKSGIDYMIDSSKKAKIKVYFGAPSCVPATRFETSGASINKDDIEELFSSGKTKFLSEVMNFPGVISNDKDVINKINKAKNFNCPIDGHAAGLTGSDLQKYIEAGISTDHECYSYKEAIEKIKLGLNIQIREGSAAKNFDTLIDLIDKYPDKIMFCTDDLHPDDLLIGHINLLVRRAIEKEKNIFDVLRAVSYNPIKHYNLDLGLLQVGDKADFLVVDNLQNFNIKEVWIDGKSNRETKNNVLVEEEKGINNFSIKEIETNEIEVEYNNESEIRIIEVIDGELITNEIFAKPKVINQKIVSNVENDILKIVVVNRYNQSRPAVGFIKNIGLKQGAFASSIAHDSHNIIAVGTNDKDILSSINLIIAEKGGISITNGTEKDILPLPIAGIISDREPEEVAKKYKSLTKNVKKLGSKLKAPFMTLSFMALIVIPKLKISDKGLFDVEKFKFVKLGQEDN